VDEEEWPALPPVCQIFTDVDLAGEALDVAAAFLCHGVSLAFGTVGGSEKLRELM
jgi:hypothetical protein